jgi:hypothetical protein
MIDASQLISIVEELNVVLELDPPIDPTLPVNVLLEEVEAVFLMTEEEDKFSDNTRLTINSYLRERRKNKTCNEYFPYFENTELARLDHRIYKLKLTKWEHLNKNIIAKTLGRN